MQASAQGLFEGGLRRASRLNYRKGINIYERKEEWDVLIILDACRPDALASVADDYGFFEPSDTHPSVASCSKHWMERTFTQKFANDIAETVFVCGNPYSAEYIKNDRFRAVIEPWRTHWSTNRGTILARPITDAAIAAHREYRPRRMIIHYMQPHIPSVPDPLSDGTSPDEWGGDWMTPFDKVKKGNISIERAWDSYIQNLRYVLGDVETLLNNLNADCPIISADHANAYGEFGVYGHPPNFPLKCIRQVPWFRATATDSGDYEPDEGVLQQIDVEESGQSVQEKLRALGYAE